MSKQRNFAPFASFGADMKEARHALGYTQKALAEELQIATRYLANIENSGSTPSLPLFYEIVNLCKLPVERYFYPEAAEVQGNREKERIALKLDVCPDKYLPIIEGALDAAIKVDKAGAK
jgi:transcriptional regulator with XRE-family HTH domain